ncbi:hypothetical protein NHQ30_007309 [Ciborinia camelliae]|nr:hypothetical protein NHQ30_007309 [Ciborinia camelliae]
MSGMPNMGGPVGGGMPMNNGVAGGSARHSTSNDNNRSQLNTYIYEYFLKSGMYDCARTLLNHEQINVVKDSPGRGDAEDGDDSKDDIDSKRPNDLPRPNLPKECPESCFLYEWFCLFWDMFNAQRGKGEARNVLSYVAFTQQSRLKTEQHQTQLRGMSQMNAGAPYGRMGPGGMMAQNDLPLKAMMNGRASGPSPQQLQQMQQMQMQKQQQQQAMQREPSDGNQQRAQSPGSTENAPSPSKRPRLDGPPFNGQGGMAPNGRGQPTGITGQQVGETGPSNTVQAAHLQLSNGIDSNLTAQQFQGGFQGQNPTQNNNNLHAYQAKLSQQQQKQMPNAPAGGPPNQGSPMMTQGSDNAMAYGYVAGEIGQNGVRGAPGGQQGGQQGNHALQDYQMQLMLLEQQNKKRLMMARQEQETVRPDGQGGPGGPGMGPNGPNFQQGTSPQSGARSVNSPNPSEQMKRRTPHMNNPGIPSPLPEGQNRGSPSAMTFMGQGGPMDAGMNAQYYKMNGMDGNMMQNGMRPPSSHPGGFNPQGMSQQQMMMARQQAGWQNGPNGAAPMVANPSQGPPQAMGTPQQRNMPPPAAPANASANGRTQPSSPQGSTAAPPTPQQSNKANPKKKNETKETKTKRATKKGSAANLNAGATPSADPTQEAATPTPATPITPIHAKGFSNTNGAVQPVNGQPMATAPNAGVSVPQSDPLTSFPINEQFDMLEFQNPMGGSTDVLDNFDFDSFLNDSTAGPDDNYNFDGFLGDNEISEAV